MEEKGIHTGHRERLRTRFMHDGLDSFEDHQVLELLLFYCIPRQDTNALAHKLLNEYGTLYNLFDADPQDVMNRCKVSKNIAVLMTMVPGLVRRYTASKFDNKAQVLDTSRKAGLYAVSLLLGLNRECFYAICLNLHRKVIYAEKLSEGTQTDAPLYPRNLMETLLKYKATGVVLAHNHPGGMLSPSRNDITATKKIIDLLTPVGIEVVDHIIVAGDQYYSFSEHKTLPLWY